MFERFAKYVGVNHFFRQDDKSNVELAAELKDSGLSSKQIQNELDRMGVSPEEIKMILEEI